MVDNSAAMGRARRRDGQAKRDRATRALQAMVDAGEPITFPAVARRAAVSVTLLYADASLAAGIAQARDRQHQAGRDRAWKLPARALVTEQSLRTDLANSKEQVRRLTEEVKLLRGRLARELGAEADMARGRHLSAPLVQLEQRATELAADNAALQLRVEALQTEARELTDNLQAARSMNRELMTELNRSPSEAPRQQPETPSPTRSTARPQQQRSHVSPTSATQKTRPDQAPLR